MELAYRNPSPLLAAYLVRSLKPKAAAAFDVNFQFQAKKNLIVTSALPETAAAVVITATAVGAAATLLMKRTKVSNEKEVTLKTCEDCSGTGICSECNGEGFVLKKMSGESVEKARMNAKNAATRYTSGLPKKWTYCTKCSSARSCCTCGGRGKLIQ